MAYFTKILKITLLLFLIFELTAFMFTVPAQAYDVEIPIKSTGEKTYKTEGGMAIGEYIADIYKFSIGAVGVIAAVVLMYGGMLWIMAGGSQEKIGEAKAWIGASLTGIFLFMTSYIILNLINPNLITFQPIAPAKITGTLSGTSTIAPAGNKLSESAAESRLRNALLSYNKCTKSDPEKEECAILNNINQGTIDEVITLSFESKCHTDSIFITSGTEGGHAEGTYSHANGYKVDLSKRACLTNYIQSNYTKLPNKRSDGADMYVNSRNQCYALESDHWDVKAAGNGCP